MTGEKTPLDQLLDVVVYAPFGLLANARELVPKLAEQGREQLDLQVRIARMLGQFAVAKGRQEAGKALQRLHEQAPAPRTPATPAAVIPHPRATTAAPSAPLAEDEVITVRHDDDDPALGVVVTAGELAIPEYDALAASQVVQRLEGLTADELEAVRRYEQAHRARKTVLGKVAQLQAR